jgi:hypothetical protein
LQEASSWIKEPDSKGEKKGYFENQGLLEQKHGIHFMCEAFQWDRFIKEKITARANPFQA